MLILLGGYHLEIHVINLNYLFLPAIFGDEEKEKATIYLQSYNLFAVFYHQQIYEVFNARLSCSVSVIRLKLEGCPAVSTESFLSLLRYLES